MKFTARRNIKKAGLLPSTPTKFESPLRASARSSSKNFHQNRKAFFFFISFLFDTHLWARNSIWMLIWSSGNQEVTYSINKIQSLKSNRLKPSVDICRCSEGWRWWHHPSSSCQVQRTYQREISQQTILPVQLLSFSNNLSNKKKLTELVVFPPKPFFVVIQVHLRQVLVRPIAPHPSVPTLPGQC